MRATRRRGVIDPLAALLIAAIAIKEGAELWRGEECECHAVLRP